MIILNENHRGTGGFTDLDQVNPLTSNENYLSFKEQIEAFNFNPNMNHNNMAPDPP